MRFIIHLRQASAVAKVMSDKTADKQDGVTRRTMRKLARNDFPNMPPLMGLVFLWERVFYNDIAMTALGFTSKLAPENTICAAFRSRDWALVFVCMVLKRM
ncbi:MAG TPA: hypothetical protein VNX46_19160 [Candidatus Acidoferrum sp.]|nr:hypothetical protein [Candidatus Acidoferrum sp.]